MRDQIARFWHRLRPDSGGDASPQIREANRNLAISTASMGLAVTGALTLNPLLLLASAPLFVYVFLPAFRLTYTGLRHERRIPLSTLDATRIAVCAVMGFYVTGAINAWLFAISRRLLVQSQEDFDQALEQLYGQEEEGSWIYVNGTEIEMETDRIEQGVVVSLAPGDRLPVSGMVVYGSAWIQENLMTGRSDPILVERGDLIEAESLMVSGQIYVQVAAIPQDLLSNQMQEILHQGTQSRTLMQQAGDTISDQVAPILLFTFAITTPFMGVNRGAAFLCTSLGGHMRNLGPLSLRTAIKDGARNRILIRDSKALEMANLINTLIIDARLLQEPEMREQAADIIHGLRRRVWAAEKLLPHKFAVYLLATGSEAQAQQWLVEIGADDFFIKNTGEARAALVQQLQTGMRSVCYIGPGQGDQEAMEKAMLSIVVGPQAINPAGPAQISLIGSDLSPLPYLFNLAHRFTVKERFNLVTPVLLDTVDIFTTVFMHLGLAYSTLFNYGGLLLGIANSWAAPDKATPDVAASRSNRTPLFLRTLPSPKKESV